MKELMVFRVGGHPFGLDLAWIKGVYRTGDLEPAPGREPGGPPLYRLEGRKVALHDLSRSLETGGGGEPEDPFRRILLLEVRGREIALGVDRVERVSTVGPDRISPLPPIFTGQSRSWFPRVLRADEALIPILDPEPVAAGGEPDPDLIRRLQSKLRENRVADILLGGIRNGISKALHREAGRSKGDLAETVEPETTE